MKTGPKPKPFDELFWPKVKKTDSCWIWTGKINTRGYGLFYFRHKCTVAHRKCYLVLKGKIPKGLVLDHLCRNSLCVNPNHLEPVTQKENLARGVNTPSSRTHCPQGHSYSQENTCVEHYGRKIGRRCKICKRNRANIYYRTHHEERLAYARKRRAFHHNPSLSI